MMDDSRPLTAALATLTTAHLDTVVQLFREIIRDAGTSTLPPDDIDQSWGPHLIEVQLHGVFAQGLDWQEATRNWIKAAQRLVDPEQERREATAALLAASNSVLKSPKFANDPKIIRKCCETILTHSNDRSERAAASLRLNRITPLPRVT